MAPKNSLGSVSADQHDIMFLKVRLGKQLALGRFDNARFLLEQINLIKNLRVVAGKRRQPLSQSEVAAMKAADAWILGNGPNAKFYAEESSKYERLENQAKRK